MELQLANATGDVKEQLQDFLKVGGIGKNSFFFLHRIMKKKKEKFNLNVKFCGFTGRLTTESKGAILIKPC